MHASLIACTGGSHACTQGGSHTSRRRFGSTRMAMTCRRPCNLLRTSPRVRDAHRVRVQRLRHGRGHGLPSVQPSAQVPVTVLLQSAGAHRVEDGECQRWRGARPRHDLRVVLGRRRGVRPRAWPTRAAAAMLCVVQRRTMRCGNSSPCAQNTTSWVGFAWRGGGSTSTIELNFFFLLTLPVNAALWQVLVGSHESRITHLLW